MILAQSLRNSNVDLDIEQVSPGTLHGSVKGVRVTFLQYQYPLLEPLEQWNEMSCQFASLEDIACMKLSAIAQRGARKDFCDIYVLGKKAFSLSQMLSFYQKKFSISILSVKFLLFVQENLYHSPQGDKTTKITEKTF